jgi:hypothetical protein
MGFFVAFLLYPFVVTGGSGGWEVGILGKRACVRSILVLEEALMMHVPHCMYSHQDEMECQSTGRSAVLYSGASNCCPSDAL